MAKATIVTTDDPRRLSPIEASIMDLLKFRNFGRKSLTELTEVIEEKNLHFGMDVTKYLDKNA